MTFFKHTITSVEDLIPYSLNSRTHSDEQVAQLAASIREFGFTNPVLIDDSNNLIAGHGRVLACPAPYIRPLIFGFSNKVSGTGGRMFNA